MGRARFALVGAAIACGLTGGVSTAAAAPGAPDPSFAMGGAYVNQFGDPSTGSFFRAAVLQPDGKIVLAGLARDASGNDEVLVVRLNANGTLDANFGTGGAYTHQFGDPSHPSSNVTAVALQPDGKIIIAGGLRDASNVPRVFVARLNPDGTLDASFAGGAYIHQFGDPTHGSFANAVALQPDSKIVLAGSAYNASNNEQVLVARLNPDGTLDTGFNGGSYIHQFGDPGHPSSRGSAVTLQPDGGIVIAGDRDDASGNPQVLVARLNPNGTLDMTFAGGAYVHNFGDPSHPISEANAVALQRDGKIVAAGFANGASGQGQVLALRLVPDGTPDTNFGTGGAYIHDFGDPSHPGSHAFNLALQPDGKIVIAGDANDAASNTGPLAARLNTNGNLDTGFGTGGAYFQEIPSYPFSGASGLALQPDGKVILAGDAETLTTDAPFALRLLGNPGPTAAFAFSPSQALLGVPVGFDGSSSTDAYDPIVSYAWNFGDGTTGTGAKPTHTYNKPGTYTVTLAVTDQDGLQALAQHTITTANPALKNAHQSNKSWDDANKPVHVSTPIGTTFTFTLNETAKVTFAFKQGKHKRGTLTFSGRPGINRVRFYGQLKHKHRLAPGTYTVTITATDGGRHSNQLKLTFKILG